MSTACRPPADIRESFAGCIFPAVTPPDTVVYAIGDIHGRSDLLETIHNAISDDSRLRSVRRTVIVYLGDYLSRGIDSRRALEMVGEWRPDGCETAEIVPLKGNHEDLALRYLDGEIEAGRHWFDFDGLDALAHYGVESVDRRERDAEAMGTLRWRFALARPTDHLQFLQSLKTSHREGNYLFVHAGIRPGVALEAQSDHDRMWIRGRFLNSEADHGVTVVHGHSIASEPVIRHNRIGIDTGAYTSGILTCLVLEGAKRAFLHT